MGGIDQAETPWAVKEQPQWNVFGTSELGAGDTIPQGAFSIGKRQQGTAHGQPVYPLDFGIFPDGKDGTTHSFDIKLIGGPGPYPGTCSGNLPPLKMVKPIFGSGYGAGQYDKLPIQQRYFPKTEVLGKPLA
jgi:hypothetical protein